MKQEEPLLPAGTEVAKQQLDIVPYSPSGLEMNHKGACPLLKDNDRNYFIITGDDFTVEISKERDSFRGMLSMGENSLKMIQRSGLILARSD